MCGKKKPAKIGTHFINGNISERMKEISRNLNFSPFFCFRKKWISVLLASSTPTDPGCI